MRAELKLVPPSARSPFYRMRGTHLGRYLDRSTRTGDRKAAAKILASLKRQIEKGEFEEPAARRPGLKEKPRRTAFRQCDVERAIRAAQATNAGPVVVRLDGSLVIEPKPTPEAERPVARLPAWTKEIVL